MKRTQIYLDPDVYRVVKLLAAASGQTASLIIRQTLAQHLKPQKTKQKSPLNSLVAIGKLPKKYPPLSPLPPDFSLRLDHYLYGSPKNHGTR